MPGSDLCTAALRGLSAGLAADPGNLRRVPGDTQPDSVGSRLRRRPDAGDCRDPARLCVPVQTSRAALRGHPHVAQHRRERARTTARSGALMQPDLRTKKPAAGGGAASFSKRTEQRLGGGVPLFLQTSLGGGVGRLKLESGG